MNAPAGFGVGHPLDAVHATFVLELAIGTLALNHKYSFLAASQVTERGRQKFNLPTLTLGKARVHAVQVPGKERGFVATGTGAHFDNDILFVVRVLR